MDHLDSRMDDPNIDPKMDDADPDNPSDPDLEMELNYLNVSFTLSCVVLAFCILGVLTNLVSTIIYSHISMRSSINVLLTGLSITDMCLCLCAVPTFVIPSMCIYHHPDHILCTVTKYSTLYVYPLTTGCQTCSVWTFVVITFERWIAVCKPFRSLRASTGRSIRALTCVLILSISYNLVRFFEHTQSAWITVHNESENCSLNGNLVEELLRKDEYYMTIYYSGMYLLTHFLIPFTVIACVNGKMIHCIHEARKQRQKLSSREMKEHRTAIMMGALVFVFVCCNSLTFVLNFAEQLHKDLFKYSSTKMLMFTLNDVSNLLVLLQASTTIFFYLTCSQKYRQLFLYYALNICNCAKKGHKPRFTVRMSNMASCQSMASGCPVGGATGRARANSRHGIGLENQSNSGLLTDEMKSLIPAKFLAPPPFNY